MLKKFKIIKNILKCGKTKKEKKENLNKIIFPVKKRSRKRMNKIKKRKKL